MAIAKVLRDGGGLMAIEDGVARWRDWALRPIVLFVAACTINGILHESSHAVTASCLGVPSTLFHTHVNVQGSPTDSQRATIGAAGPLFSLAFGFLCWLARVKVRGSPAELPLLYLAVFGLSMFLGNLMSVWVVGDFRNAADALRLPATPRYTASVMGALGLAGLMFRTGWELRRWVPAGVGRLKGLIGVIALPALVGTAAVVLAYLPMPRPMVFARVTEGSLWVFAAGGALIGKSGTQVTGRGLGLRWTDGAVTLLAILIVRVMARGIPLVP